VSQPITNEHDWFAALSVIPLRDWCRNHLKRDRRKHRLFACACCRRLWDHLPDERSRKAIEASEAYADGKIDKKALTQARRAATRASSVAPKSPLYTGSGWAAEDAAQMLANQGFTDVFVACTARALFATMHLGLRSLAEEEAEQAKLLRDVFGNPFRPVAFDPAWRTETVVAMAETLYESRDFSAMPILADALQDAGCDSDDVLNHCRNESQPHTRGCWVVDLVLGKE
jgi:hypothetical protein